MKGIEPNPRIVGLFIARAGLGAIRRANVVLRDGLHCVLRRPTKSRLRNASTAIFKVIRSR